ncbi:hypothetical protein BDR07DRAFT_1377165 [Suillus spraguei]|nr:hypothetical protein BDR07DRAFT_1377165 [Suillus spraguei]
MAPSQLRKPKKKSPSAAHSSDRFGFRQPTSTSSQNIRKAPWSNERTHEEEAESQAPEYCISNNNQDQYQTDGENEERDGVQDQEQMLETGDTMDFGQHADDLDSKYDGAQEDFNNQDFDYEPDAVCDFLNQGINGDFDDEPDTQRDKPDAQDNGIGDDFNNELNDAARDKTEESVLIFVLSHSKSPCRLSSRCVVSTGFSALVQTRIQISALCHLIDTHFNAQDLHIGVWHRLVDTHLSQSTFSSCATLDEPDSRRNKRRVKTSQDNPAKLGFYPPAWQVFLQAAKLEMRLQAVLTHPIPEH